MTDEEVQEHSSEQEIQGDIIRLAALKKQKAELEAEIADIQAYLDKTIEKEIRFEDEETGDRIQATVVRGTVDRFDEHLISTRYPIIWDAITRLTLDKGKYLNAIKTGLITPELNARFHAEVPRKSFVKITRYVNGNAIEASE